MSSDTDIANMAMRLLKANRITSLSDGSNNANAANDIFTEIRDGLLRGHSWNFASVSLKLAKSSTAPVLGFDNAFPLPSDWLRTVKVSDNDADAGPPPLYREEEVANQGTITTDVAEIWLRYVYRVTDVNRMAADFILAFAYALAVGLPGISNLSAAREERLVDRAEGKLRRAKHSDALGSTPDMRPPGSWATVRGGWPTWRQWPS